MKNFQIRYSEEFSDHLESFIAVLENKSPQAANKLRDDIKVKLLNLKDNPFQWSKVISPVERLTKYRRFISIYDYLTFYFVDKHNKIVYVIDIFHGKQNYWHLLR